MKPSEYFKKKLKDCSDKTYFERLEELDLKYIGREELKSKIHKNSKCLNIDTEYYDGYRQAIKDVLELLK